MRKIVMGLVVATALGLSSTAVAGLEASYQATCYTFKNGVNKPSSTGVCSVYHHSGAGGSVDIITYKGKKYRYEDQHILDENGDWTIYEDKYRRDLKTYQKLPEVDDYISTRPYMNCRPGKKVDLCYYDKSWFE